MPDFLPTWDTASVTALRGFAGIRLLALDVDGTLLQPSSHDVFLTIRNLANSTLLRQIAFVIATGRTLHGVTPVLRQWPSTANSAVVLYNGSIIANPRTHRVTQIRTIPYGSVATVLRLCQRHRRPVLAYICRPHAAPISNTEFEEVYGWSHNWRPEREFNGLRIKWQPDWQYSEQVAPAALLVKTVGSARVTLAELLSDSGSIDVTTSGGAFLEIRPRGSNKATSLRAIASELGLSADKVLAIGDNDNDVEMLRWAGIGVAVAGASPDALANANYVCHYGVARGVVEILRLIRSARRYYGGEIERRC